MEHDKLAGLDNYAYRPLLGTAIRLIRLMPSSASENPIICHLVDLPLDAVLHRKTAPSPDYLEEDAAPSSYYALSYVWGPRMPTRLIMIKGSHSVYKMEVRSNLYDALKRLRNPRYVRTLWIDRLSIDQTNVVERVSQVALMGKIYATAYSVVVWLGETTSSLDPFKELLAMGREAEAWYEKVLAEGKNVALPHFDEIVTVPVRESEEYRRMCALLDNLWFTRAWTAQEVALAGEAYVMQGPYLISHSFFDYVGCTLEKYCMLRDPRKSWIVKKADALRQMYAIRSYMHGTPVRGEHSQVHVSMAQLVQDYRARDATDPRDKVWAFLGIADDSEDLKAHIDYVGAWQTIFTKYAHWMCRHYRSLRMLQLVHVKNDESDASGLPSWVADLRSEVPLLDCMYQTLDPSSNNNIRNPLPPDQVYAASGSSQFECCNELDSPVLAVRGIKIGNIVSVSCPSGNFTNNVAIGTAVKLGGDWSMLARETYAPQNVYTHTGEPIGKAFSRLTIGDLLPGEKGRRRHRSYFPDPLPEANVSIVSEVEGRRWEINTDSAIGNSILNATTNRRFFITATKYMGLAHQSVVVGDEVWVLMGADMPVILRPARLHTVIDSPFGKRFRFRGEAYVHGAMDGEILVKERRKRDPGLGDDTEWLKDLGLGPWPFDTETIVIE